VHFLLAGRRSVPTWEVEITSAEAEKLPQVAMIPAEREMAAATGGQTVGPRLERPVGPRKVYVQFSATVIA